MVLNDASQGTVSSYAWVVMAIHYLQHVGVVPHLQSMGHEPDFVDGMDCGFHVPPEWRSANTAPAAALLAGFFEFYASFDFRRHLVDIAVPHTMVARTPGTFRDRPMLVLDPFERDHNLTKGVEADVLRNIARLSSASLQYMCKFSPATLPINAAFTCNDLFNRAAVRKLASLPHAAPAAAATTPDVAAAATETKRPAQTQVFFMFISWF